MAEQIALGLGQGEVSRGKGRVLGSWSAVFIRSLASCIATGGRGGQ